jgi:hypothetical protein
MSYAMRDDIALSWRAKAGLHHAVFLLRQFRLGLVDAARAGGR